MLPVTQLLGLQQNMGTRAVASQGQFCRQSRRSAAIPLLCSRLHCVSFQSSNSPLAGQQPSSRPAAGTARPLESEHAASSGQQQGRMHKKSHAKLTGNADMPVQDSASNDAMAAGKQDADRKIASEGATTSGREYWQVGNL